MGVGFDTSETMRGYKFGAVCEIPVRENIVVSNSLLLFFTAILPKWTQPFELHATVGMLSVRRRADVSVRKAAHD